MNARPIMTEKEVLELIGYGRTSLWKMRRSGTFPAPIDSGLRAVRFRRSEVEAWINGDWQTKGKA